MDEVKRRTISSIIQVHVSESCQYNSSSAMRETRRILDNSIRHLPLFWDRLFIPRPSTLFPSDPF